LVRIAYLFISLNRDLHLLLDHPLYFHGFRLHVNCSLFYLALFFLALKSGRHQSARYNLLLRYIISSHPNSFSILFYVRVLSCLFKSFQVDSLSSSHSVEISSLIMGRSLYFLFLFLRSTLLFSMAFMVSTPHRDSDYSTLHS
jgi:hypothetical protein